MRFSALAHSSKPFTVALSGGSTPRRLYQLLAEPPLGTTLRFDLILLGLGADGHTASLFPNTSALKESQRLVAPVYVENLEAWRVTLTLPALSAAHNVLFLVTGHTKSPALARIAGGELLPAALVRPPNGTLTWLVDRKAVGQDQSLHHGSHLV